MRDEFRQRIEIPHICYISLIYGTCVGCRPGSLVIGSKYHRRFGAIKLTRSQRWATVLALPAGAPGRLLMAMPARAGTCPGGQRARQRTGTSLAPPGRLLGGARATAGDLA